MNEIKRLGIIVRKYRKLKKISTQELANKMGVSVGLINNIENSKNDVFKLRLLNMVISNLGIPVEEIFEYKDNDFIIELNKHDTSEIKIIFKNNTLIRNECLLECIMNLIKELISFLGQFDDEELALRTITAHFRRIIIMINQLHSK